MPEKSKSTKAKKAPATSPKTEKVTKRLPFRSKETISSSDEESSDEEEAAPIKKTNAAAESSSSDAESDEEEEEEEEEAAPVKAKGTSKEKTSTSTVKSTPTAAPVARAPPVAQSIGEYKPPADFTRISKSEVSSSNPFSAKNLEGKEIWYIKAPVTASLSTLSTVNPVDVAEGNAVMEVDGRSYCLRPEEDANADGAGVGILLPDSIGQYRAGKKPVAKTFSIVETLPKNLQIPENHVPKPKPVREQPKGLKQRFTPIGADLAPTVADADKMDIDEPEPVVQESKKKKHKSSHGDGENGEKRKKKKSKKEAVP